SYVLLNHREQPTLVLHGNREAQIRTNRIVASHADVGQRATARNELLADLLEPEVDVHAIARAEPVVGPCLSPLSLAPDPASYQVCVVCVSLFKPKVIVEKAVA